MIDSKLDDKHKNGVTEIKYVPTETGELISKYNYRPDTLFLYFSIITANLLTLSGTACITWTSPSIPKLLSNDTNINPLSEPITTIETSLMAGLPFFAGLVGTILAPRLSDIIGRKGCLQITGFGMLLCNVMVAFSTKALYIIMARCTLLMFYGGGITVTIMFVTEICEVHNKAKFGCVLSLFIPLGSLFAYICGSSFSVKVYTLILSIPIVAYLFLFYFVTETPVYLLAKDKKRECIETLKQLRSNKTENEIDADFYYVSNAVDYKEGFKNVNITSLFRTKVGGIGVLFGLLPTIIQNLSGGTAVIGFLGTILNDAGTNVSGDNVAIIIGLVQCFCVAVASLLVEKTGRKPLLIISSMGSSISMIVLGWFFYMRHIDSSLARQLTWLPIVAVLSYNILYSVGLGPIPAGLISEMFSPELRSTGSSFIMTLNTILLSILMFGFPIAIQTIGYHWCFFIFGVNSFIGAVSIYILLPETKGVSAAELQEIMKNYKFKLRL